MATAQELVEAAQAIQLPLDPDAVQAMTDAGTWVVANMRDVEWALEQAAQSQAEVDGIQQQLVDLVNRAKARAAQLEEKAQARLDFFKGRIAEYAEAHRDELLVGKKKSRDFLSGRVGWRLKTGRLVVTDKLLLNEWLAEQAPHLYRVVLEPQMKELQAQAKQDGIIPPGCTYNEEQDELFVEAQGLPTLEAVVAKKELK